MQTESADITTIEVEALGAQIGAKIKKHRLALGMTQKELAELSTVSQEGISKIERGDANPRFITVAMLCHALGIAMKEFMPNADAYAVVVK